ncbi:unnamed protein product [Protopolystoma xenopodis]|uniref:Uncharacterized protein n=1 Tax=Protopolystoma xenopodis TaxID=117903 RepID=A0A448XA09_9PLAT|nr:unnamed protein product [Protopolystoma xenopodis]
MPRLRGDNQSTTTKDAYPPKLWSPVQISELKDIPFKSQRYSGRGQHHQQRYLTNYEQLEAKGQNMRGVQTKQVALQPRFLTPKQICHQQPSEDCDNGNLRVQGNSGTESKTSSIFPAYINSNLTSAATNTMNADSSNISESFSSSSSSSHITSASSSPCMDALFVGLKDSLAASSQANLLHYAFYLPGNEATSNSSSLLRRNQSYCNYTDFQNKANNASAMESLSLSSPPSAQFSTRIGQPTSACECHSDEKKRLLSTNEPKETAMDFCTNASQMVPLMCLNNQAPITPRTFIHSALIA